VKEVDLRKGYQNPKRKFGVTMHFSEVIELYKTWKEIAHTFFFFNAFLE